MSEKTQLDLNELARADVITALLEETDVKFDDNRHLKRIIDSIVSRVGRRVDESSPMVDARLPDGSRFNAIIPPLALDGPMVFKKRE